MGKLTGYPSSEHPGSFICGFWSQRGCVGMQVGKCLPPFKAKKFQSIIAKSGPPPQGPQPGCPKQGPQGASSWPNQTRRFKRSSPTWKAHNPGKL